MSLVLVDNRKGMWPHNLCTDYLLSLHSSSFTTILFPSPVQEGDEMVLNRMGESARWKDGY